MEFFFGSLNIHSNLPGPETITRSELSNGIVLLVRQNAVSHSVVLSGYLSAGSYLDPEDKLGLAHFSALGITRGTARQDFQAFHDTIESVGASLGFGASVHTTGFGGRSLKEDLPLILGLLSDCIRQPAFPSEEIERLRQQMLTNLAIRVRIKGFLLNRLTKAKKWLIFVTLSFRNYNSPL